MTLADITPSDITPNKNLSFHNSLCKQRHSNQQIVDSALQMSIDNLLMEDQDASTGSTAKEHTSQATGSHWLP